MKRIEFLKQLQFVGESLGQNTGGAFIGFAGGRIFACGGHIACSVANNEFNLDKVALDGKSLISIVSCADGEDISLELDGRHVVIKSGSLKSKMSVMDFDKIAFPASLTPDTKSFQITGADACCIVEAMRECSSFVSKDKSTHELCGYLFNGNVMFATDRFRIAKFLLSVNVPTCVIYPNLAKMLTKYYVDIEKITFSGHDIEITYENGDVCIGSTYANTYASMAEQFVCATSGISMVLPKELSSILDGHASFQSETTFTNKEIKVTLNKDSIQVHTTKVGGELDNVIPVPAIDGLTSPISFFIHPDFLKEFVAMNGATTIFPSEEKLVVELGFLKVIIMISSTKA